MTDVMDEALVIGYGGAAQLHWEADWRGIAAAPATASPTS